jgi:hypothetical protein
MSGWTTPGPLGITLSDYVGQLVFVLVGGYEPSVQTGFGDRPAVRATVVILTGPEANAVYRDALLFNSRVVQRLRGSVGQTILAAVVYGEGKGANAPVDLVDPGPAAAPVAQAFDQANPGLLADLLASTIESHRVQQVKTQPAQQQRPAQNQGQWGGQQQSPPNGGQWNNQGTTTTNTGSVTWGSNVPAQQQATPQQPAQAQPWSPSQSVTPGVPPATQEQAGF